MQKNWMVFKSGLEMGAQFILTSSKNGTIVRIEGV
jgi:hypothetical protein